MPSIKYLIDPGFVCDLLSLYVYRFNEDYFISSFSDKKKALGYIENYKNIIKETNSIPEKFLLFFKLNDKNISFAMYYSFHSDSSLFDGTFTYKSFLAKFSDYSFVIKAVLKFYFDNVSDSILNNYQAFITDIYVMIRDSEYDPELKNSLYGFFLDPTPVIKSLISDFSEKSPVVDKIHDKNRRQTIEAQSIVNIENIYKYVLMKVNQKHDWDNLQNVYVSFSVIFNECIYVYFKDKTVSLISDFDFESRIKEFKIPDLSLFGTSLSEKNRVDILNLISEKGEATIKDIEQELKFTGTNSYYHLSLMINAGLLKSRYKGRTVYYTIDKSYVQSICDFLKRYL